MFTFPSPTAWRPEQLAQIKVSKLRHCQPIYTAKRLWPRLVTDAEHSPAPDLLPRTIPTAAIVRYEIYSAWRWSVCSSSSSSGMRLTASTDSQLWLASRCTYPVVISAQWATGSTSWASFRPSINLFIQLFACLTFSSDCVLRYPRVSTTTPLPTTLFWTLI